MCDIDFATWLVGHVEASSCQTTGAHLVVRVHGFGEQEMEEWRRGQSLRLVGGYLPHPGCWYVTQELDGVVVSGSPHYGSEQQALAVAERLVDATVQAA